MGVYVLPVRSPDHATCRSEWFLVGSRQLGLIADNLGILCVSSMEVMGEAENAFVPLTVHVVCHVPPQVTPELTISVVLFVLCILLQIFAMDGYTTRKFQIVLYAWVSSLRTSTTN